MGVLARLGKRICSITSLWIVCHTKRLLTIQEFAVSGLIFAPLAALTIGLIFSRGYLRLALVTPVLLAPLFFGLIFFMVMGHSPLLLEIPDDGYFDAFTAAQNFYNYILRLSFTGSVVGLVIAAGMSGLFRKVSLN